MNHSSASSEPIGPINPATARHAQALMTLITDNPYIMAYVEMAAPDIIPLLAETTQDKDMDATRVLNLVQGFITSCDTPIEVLKTLGESKDPRDIVQITSQLIAAALAFCFILTATTAAIIQNDEHPRDRAPDPLNN